ncbi:MAG: DUF4129 domain-containing protein [Thermoplasmatota archaeon]
MANPLSRLPPGAARFLARWGVLAAFAIVALVILGVVAAALLQSPATILPRTKISETAQLPESISSGFLKEADADHDGLPDALENYVYGTDPANWNSSGMGIPDGWLVKFGYDPLAAATKTATGATPPVASLPPAYHGVWPDAFKLPLSRYYAVGRPATYRPGQDDPWWLTPGAKTVDPTKVDLSGSGIPTAWLVYYGLDPFDPHVGERVAPNSPSRLTINESYHYDTNPLVADTDKDGLDDWDEIHTFHTDPSRFSTAGCGIADGWLVHYGLDPLDPNVCNADPDQDGMTNLEEFLWSNEHFHAEVAANGIQFLNTHGLDPKNWDTSGTFIPDGWYVRYGLDPLDPTQASVVIDKASNYPDVKWLNAGPEGQPALPDLSMTVRDAYDYGKPANWDENVSGVWWGGTNPATKDTDGDGLPDAVEIRGWYVNLTRDVGPSAKHEWVVVHSSPVQRDSDGDGLTDLEEYKGATTCGATASNAPVRTFPPTDPNARDSAGSGLSDFEKVCGIVRGAAKFDFFGKKTATGDSLDPTRADSVGDFMKDGARFDYWETRALRYQTSTQYEFNDSLYKDVFDWVTKYPRFAGMDRATVLAQFRPDGDIDGDGIVNMLDADPSGGLLTGGKTTVFLPQGLRIDPTLFRYGGSYVKYPSQFPRSATDPANPDTDGDGLPDWWETKFQEWDPAKGGWNLDPAKYASGNDGQSDATKNFDNDIVGWVAYRSDGATRKPVTSGFANQPYDYNNLEKYRYGTDPNLVSTLNDGVRDGWKAFWGNVYPAMASQNQVGDLSNADLATILDASQSGAIGTNVNLKDIGAKTFSYTRFLSLDPATITCTATSVRSYLEKTGLAAPSGSDNSTLPQFVDSGLYARQDATGKNVCIAPLKGTWTLTYAHEVDLSTNPYLNSTSGTGLPDAYAAFWRIYGLQPALAPDPTSPADAAKAPDGDALTTLQECAPLKVAPFTCTLGLDPTNPDNDFDGIKDSVELRAHLNPLDPSDVQLFLSDKTDTDRDGITDHCELTPGVSGCSNKVATDPTNADTAASGALDGFNVLLDPVKDAATIADWKARGIAHLPSNGNVLFLGKLDAPGADPRFANSLAGDGVPDGWRIYYYAEHLLANLTSKASAACYDVGKPDWWQESIHGIWWWGDAPAGGGCQLGRAKSWDLNRNGLNDVNGEDPFPALAAGHYVFKDATGAIDTRDPAAAKAFVLATNDTSEARLRAQAWGDGAGDPVTARADAGSADANGNGVADPIDHARTELVGVRIVNGTRTLADGTLEAAKGTDLVVTGRLVLDEQDASGTWLNGDSPSNRHGVPNATVLASLFAPSRDALVGAAFTDKDGNFRLVANITTLHAMTVPDGDVLLGTTRGVASWSDDASLVSAGPTSRGLANALVVWSYNTTPAPAAGSPQDYAFKAFLPDSTGARATRTTNAVAGDALAPINLTLVSATSLTFSAPVAAVEGTSLNGSVTLTDAGGAPLADRVVTLDWTGGGTATTLRDRTIDGAPIRTDSSGSVNLSRVDLAVASGAPGDASLLAHFAPTSADSYLFPTNATLVVHEIAPTSLTLDLTDTSLVVGANALVSGELASASWRAGDGTTVPGHALPLADVTLTFGGVTLSAKTDAGGRFSLAVPVPASLGAGEQKIAGAFAGDANDAPATANAVVEVKRPTEIVGLRDLDATDGQAILVAGRLQDVSGTGLAGEHVTIVVGGASAGTVATDRNGAFSLATHVAGVPLGLSEVRASFDGDRDYAATTNASRLKVYTTSGLVLDSITTPLVRGAASGLDAPGAGEMTLVGHLADASGAPISSAAVSLAWRGVDVRDAVTDATGAFHFVFPLNETEPLGDAEVGLSYAPASTSVYRPSSLAIPVKVLAPVVLDLPASELRRGASAVTGKLTDDRGHPLPGEPVEVFAAKVDLGSARTARNGTFAAAFLVPASQNAGPLTVRAVFPGAGLLAPANTTATDAVIGGTRLAIGVAGTPVRGEPWTLSGSLAQDNGAPIAGVVHITLGGVSLGNAPASLGKWTLTTSVPTNQTTGDQALVLTYAGTPYLDPARVEVGVSVKVRPQVNVALPAIAVEGFSFSGTVSLADDHGAPLRNATFVYATGDSGLSVSGTTDAQGRASLAAVAGASSATHLTLLVKGSPDILPTEFTTQDVRVIGAGAPASVVGLFVLLVLLLALVVGLLVAARLRRKQLTEARAILDEAIRDLLAGNEFTGVIFLAYRRLSDHVKRHGFTEKKSDTPREFARGVRRAVPVDATHLKALITLFEEAKYSEHQVGAAERDNAVESLALIRADLDRLLGRRARA